MTEKDIFESDWTVTADDDRYGTFIVEPFATRQELWPFEVDDEEEQDRRLAIADKEEERILALIEAAWQHMGHFLEPAAQKGRIDHDDVRETHGRTAGRQIAR